MLLRVRVRRGSCGVAAAGSRAFRVPHALALVTLPDPISLFSRSSFAALFLFSVSGLMRNNYPYIHIHAPDLPGLASPVIYAGAWRGLFA